MNNHIQLQNNRLQITISGAGQAYKGSRFDWTGFITQIQLDNETTFCVPEQYETGKGSGGIGFCNEFGIDKPIGYEDIGVGEYFPKLGVGMLKKKDDEPYDFFTDYEIIKSTTNISSSETTSTFTSSLSDGKGYEHQLTKTISITDNQLFIDYRLENLGTKTIRTNEYNHNFIGINALDIGPSYQLTFPEITDYNIAVGNVICNKNHLEWPDTPKEDFYITLNLPLAKTSWNWDLYNKTTGAGIRECSTFDISKCAVWGTTHVVAPELFIDIDLPPATSMRW